MPVIPVEFMYFFKQGTGKQLVSRTERSVTQPLDHFRLHVAEKSQKTIPPEL